MMSSSSLAGRIKENYTARTGKQLDESAASMLEDVCQAIIDEIQKNATVTVSAGIPISVGSSTTVGPGTGTIK